LHKSSWVSSSEVSPPFVRAFDMSLPLRLTDGTCISLATLIFFVGVRKIG
jgi:hypothetical protein